MTGSPPPEVGGRILLIWIGAVLIRLCGTSCGGASSTSIAAIIVVASTPATLSSTSAERPGGSRYGSMVRTLTILIETRVGGVTTVI